MHSVHIQGDKMKDFLSKIKNPKDYFQGLGTHHPVYVEHPLIFLRSIREIVEISPKRKYHHHRHLLILSLKSSGSVIINNQEYILQENCAFLISPHQIHWFDTGQKRDLEWLFITFEYGCADHLQPLRNVNVKMDSTSQNSLIRLLEAYTSGDNYDPFKSNEVSLLTSLLINSLLRTAAMLFPPDGTGHNDNIPFLEIINLYIDQNMASGLNHSAMAASLHCSVGHLRKRFRSIYGISLGDYISTLRLQKAKALLMQSRLMIKEIAYECGFSNNSSFNRFFIRAVGQSPLEYRKSLTTVYQEAE